jgi:hypothetical protein
MNERTDNFRLDRPPAVTFTSPGPGTNTVNQPILQLQGSAPEELASVTFDIANSAGCLTNQPGIVLGRFYDTNVGWFTIFATPPLCHCDCAALA